MQVLFAQFKTILLTLNFFFFFFILKKKKLACAVIVPAHLNPNLTWHMAHLDNNMAYHYSNPQLSDLQG